MEVRKSLNLQLEALNQNISDIQHSSKFLELMEDTDCPFFLGYAHPNGRWVFVNNTFASEMGYTKKEMYEMPWIDMIKQSEQEEVKEDYVEHIQEDKRYSNYLTTYITKNGTELPIIWFTSSVHSHEDKLTLCIAIKQ